MSQSVLETPENRIYVPNFNKDQIRLIDLFKYFNRTNCTTIIVEVKNK